MKNILIISVAICGLALAGCSNPFTQSSDNSGAWQTLTGSAGIGFWGFGFDPEYPQSLLVFINTPTVTRIEYWGGEQLLRTAEWLNSTSYAITYRAPNGQIITQAYIMLDNGLELDILDVSIAEGGIFWRRERPSWWTWEYDYFPGFTGSSPRLTGSGRIGFWWGGDDPDNPQAVWVFINTASVSRIEFWVDQELRAWGHWIDAVGNTIVYRRHDFINTAIQRFNVQNDRLTLEHHFAALARGGPFWRFDGPEWWYFEAYRNSLPLETSLHEWSPELYFYR